MIDELHCTWFNIRALDARAPMEPGRERLFFEMIWGTGVGTQDNCIRALDYLQSRKEVDPEEVLRKHASKACGVTWP